MIMWVTIALCFEFARLLFVLYKQKSKRGKQKESKALGHHCKKWALVKDTMSCMRKIEHYMCNRLTHVGKIRALWNMVGMGSILLMVVYSLYWVRFFAFIIKDVWTLTFKEGDMFCWCFGFCVSIFIWRVKVW